MVNKTTQNAAAVFTAANLSTSQGVYCNLAIKAFITANGIGNINVQLTPAAVQANALMGGANFWRAMQPANGKLWLMVACQLNTGSLAHKVTPRQSQNLLLTLAG